MGFNVRAFLANLTAFIYDLFISNFLTVAAHVSMLPHMVHTSGTFLDVGCGTGAPLKKIYPTLKNIYSSFVGVDLHPKYTEKAQKLFEKEENVGIYNMDFYDLKKNFPEKKFDFILFSFSFMLMPDPVKAIRVATESLSSNGTIAFIMTLNPKERPLLEKIKPIIHHYTSIDFGNVIYEKQFEEFLKIGSLKMEKKQRITSKFNPLLWLFPVYYVEATLTK